MSTPRLLLLRSAWGLLPLLLFVFSLCHRGCSATTRGLASRSVERDDTDRDRHHSHLVDSVDKRALGTEHHEFIKPKMKTKVQEENGKAPTDMVIAGNKAGAYADEGEPGFRAVEHYPTAEESTVLFLHVFKVRFAQNAPRREQKHVILSHHRVGVIGFVILILVGRTAPGSIYTLSVVSIFVHVACEHGPFTSYASLWGERIAGGRSLEML